MSTEDITLILRLVIGAAAGILACFLGGLYENKAVKNRNLEKIEFSKKTKIWINVAMAILGALGGFSVTLNLGIPYMFICVTILYVIAIMDWKYRTIPNSASLTLLCTAIVFGIPYVIGKRFFPDAAFWTLFPEMSLKFSLICSAILFVVFFIPSLINHSVAPGDIKLAFVIGFLLGFYSFYAIILMGIFTILFFLLRMGGVGFTIYLKTMIPMGSFIGLATVLVLDLVFLAANGNVLPI